MFHFTPTSRCYAFDKDQAKANGAKLLKINGGDDGARILGISSGAPTPPAIKK